MGLYGFCPETFKSRSWTMHTGDLCGYCSSRKVEVMYSWRSGLWTVTAINTIARIDAM